MKRDFMDIGFRFKTPFLVIVLLFISLTCRLQAWGAVPEAFVQTGHTSLVQAAAFSPDGRYALSGSRDNTICLWEVSTGREVKTFKGHRDSVEAVAFSPVGKIVLSASRDKTLRLWDVITGQIIKSLKGHKKYITSAVFSPDGKYVLSGSADKTLRLWDVKAGRTLRVFKGHGDRVYAVDIDLDGKYALSGSDDKTVRLWELATGKEIRVFRGHSHFVRTVAFSPKGGYALSGSYDKTLRLWDLSTGEEVRIFSGHNKMVEAVAFSPDGRHIISGGYEKALRLWDAATGREARPFIKVPSFIWHLVFHPRGGKVLSANGDGTLGLWNLTTGKEEQVLRGYAVHVGPMDFNPATKQALVGMKDMTFRLWNLKTGKEIRVFKGHTDTVRSLAFSPDGALALSGGDYKEKLVRLWDVSTGKQIRIFKGHSGAVIFVAFSPDGKYILSGNGFNQERNWSRPARDVDSFYMWDASTGREMKLFKGHRNYITSIVFSSDGKRILSGSKDGTLRLWDVATAKPIRVFKGHRENVMSVALSPDGRYALSGGYDKTVRLWDLATGKQIKVFKGHGQWVKSVTFSPDGRYALSGSDDNTLRLWDVTSRKYLRTFKGHRDQVHSVFFGSEGRYAFSASRDGSIRIWNVESGKEVAGFYRFSDGEWVIMTPEGYFNASPKGAKHINVRIGNRVYGIENFSRRFYRPEMVELALSGKPLPAVETINTAAGRPAPFVKIMSPKDNMVTSESDVELRVKAIQTEGGVGDVYLYVNDSLVSTGTRAIKRISEGASILMTFRVLLREGKNNIKVIAYNEDNTMRSDPAIISIVSDFKSGAPSLYVLSIGIDSYENDQLNLRYAVADAGLFAKSMTGLASSLFKRVHVTLLKSYEETNKMVISQAFEKLSSEVGPSDYFVLYISSHGYIATFNNGDSKYFLLPSNVVFLDPMNLQKDAISQDELVEFIGNIPAQNKVIVLDACHSGEAGRVIQIAATNLKKAYTRGLSTATAMQLLKMASGSSVFTASQHMEEAVEGYKGHGLFTYTLVEGLKGKADDNRDGFITLSELKGYAERLVFLRSKEHFKRKQVPYINIGTLDLSLVKIE